MSKNYTNEHPKYKKNNQDNNIKVAETIKIDPIEFKLMKEARDESKGDYNKYRKIYFLNGVCCLYLFISFFNSSASCL